MEALTRETDSLDQRYYQLRSEQEFHSYRAYLAEFGQKISATSAALESVSRELTQLYEQRSALAAEERARQLADPLIKAELSRLRAAKEREASIALLLLR